LPRGSNVYDSNTTKGMMQSQNIDNGFTFNGNIIIDAKNIKEFNDVINIFQNIKTQKVIRGGAY
jgi:hypothetical protein